MKLSARLLALAAASSCTLLDADPAGLGDECLFNGDCAAPLVCAGRRCRAPCRDDRDCVNGWRCLSAGDGARRVCLPPDDRGYCALSGDCPQPFVCGADGRCGEQCREAADCRRYLPAGGLRCLSVALPEGGRAGVCENHPWLARDGGAPFDASADGALPAGDGGGDVPRPTDAPRDADAGASRCVTASADACAPGAACAIGGVTLGLSGGCAWFADGSVRCWQESSNSNLLLSAAADVYCPAPALRRPAGDLRDLEINGSTGCYRTADGLARCWGAGVLGDGTRGERASAEAVTVERYPDEGPLTDVREVRVSGGRGACAVAGPTRRVYCWGPQSANLSGDGSTALRTRAAENPFLDEVEQLALGGSHACALRRGVLWCFGASGAASGVPDAGAVAPTRTVPTGQPVVHVAAGTHHTCAVLMDRTVACFGTLLLADGVTTVEQPAPTPVAGLTDVVELAGGWLSTCARRADGTVWCWGEGWARGDGSMEARGTPAPVPGLAGIRRVFGRDRTMCALRGADELWCWGDAVGEERIGPALTPVRVRWGTP